MLFQSLSVFSEIIDIEVKNNYNDIEMLEAVGWGVAVENGREEVKNIANEITDHHKMDGLAKSLELMLNKLNFK